MKPQLRLADADFDPTTRQDVEMARIAQNWREWSPQGWKPISEPQKHSALLVDEIQAKSYKVIAVDAPIPLWRRLLRRIR